MSILVQGGWEKEALVSCDKSSRTPSYIHSPLLRFLAMALNLWNLFRKIQRGLQLAEATSRGLLMCLILTGGQYPERTAEQGDYSPLPSQTRPWDIPWHFPRSRRQKVDWVSILRRILLRNSFSRHSNSQGYEENQIIAVLKEVWQTVEEIPRMSFLRRPILLSQ